MAETIDQLQAKVAEYEKRMGIGDNDPVKEGYLVLVSILRQQNSYLKKFKIEDEISKTTKEDASYGRAQEMWEKMPKMIEGISNLKLALKMEGEEKKQAKPVSAGAIARGEAVI